MHAITRGVHAIDRWRVTTPQRVQDKKWGGNSLRNLVVPLLTEQFGPKVAPPPAFPSIMAQGKRPGRGSN